ncbi:MAG: hypothetical protein AAFV80_08650, partial [Bacteroidota bacterium]
LIRSFYYSKKSTTMLTLQERVRAIADRYKWKMGDLPNDKYRLDISIKLKDGRFRFQYVFIWLNPNDQGKTIYMNSRIGPYNNTLIYPLLKKTSANCRYSNLAIVPDQKDGKPIESFVIQAVPDVNISDELLNKIIFEVGNVADYMEESFFGGDNV